MQYTYAETESFLLKHGMTMTGFVASNGKRANYPAALVKGWI